MSLPSATPDVAVIVPTLALAERRASLHQALASVRSQAAVRGIPLVVVNGQRFDRELVAELARDPWITLIRQEEADLPAAYRLGRRHVTAPWFTALDDDDALLPGALQRRVQALQERGDFDAVVTNGYCRRADGDTPIVRDMARVARDPLGALLDSNWLLPGAWLCCTDAASTTLFDDMPPHLECTYLAVRLVTTRRVRFLDEATVVWCTETPGSASKSNAYRLGQPDALHRILSLELPAALRYRFRERLGAARHDASRLRLQEGLFLSAWKEHALSLAEPGGWRYLPQTLRLLASSLAGVRARRMSNARVVVVALDAATPQLLRALSAAGRNAAPASHDRRRPERRHPRTGRLLHRLHLAIVLHRNGSRPARLPLPDAARSRFVSLEAGRGGRADPGAAVLETPERRRAPCSRCSTFR